MKTKNFNIQGFTKIAQCTQKDLVNYLTVQIPLVYGADKCKANSSYIFAKGDIPVLLVAHLDTVHKEVPSSIYFDKHFGVIWSPQGIGGDDRCGVYSIIYILQHMMTTAHSKPSILFTTDEEVGCIGAKVAAVDLVQQTKDIKFVIELDRRDADDAVFYSCMNQKFKDYILNFGFTLAYGSCSDISKLCPAWDIAGVNLSCGYYNAHSSTEFIRVDDMFNTINKVISILSSSSKAVKYPYAVKLPPSTTTATVIDDYTLDTYYEDDFNSISRMLDRNGTGFDEDGNPINSPFYTMGS